MSYTYLSAVERMIIFHCSQYGLSGREIARRLGRSAASCTVANRSGVPPITIITRPVKRLRAGIAPVTVAVPIRPGSAPMCTAGSMPAGRPR